MNGASLNFTARNGVGVGEDAAHLGTQRRLSHQKGPPVSDTATCRFPHSWQSKKFSTVCQHRQALPVFPGNVVDSDASREDFTCVRLSVSPDVEIKIKDL